MTALSGKRILITRPVPDAGSCPLAEALSALGADVVRLPLTAITPTNPLPPMDFSSYTWLLFTSASAAQTRLAPLPPTTRIAVVGEATADAVTRTFGQKPNFISPVFEGAAAAKALATTHPLNGQRVLWLCGNLANNTTEATLHAAGARVDRLVVYQTTPKTALTPEETRLFKTGFDAVAFTSPSAVEAFHALNLPLDDNTRIASIGPTTAAAAQRLLGQSDVVATPHTLADLARAIACYYQQ